MGPAKLTSGWHTINQIEQIAVSPTTGDDCSFSTKVLQKLLDAENSPLMKGSRPETLSSRRVFAEAYPDVSFVATGCCTNNLNPNCTILDKIEVQFALQMS